MPALKKNTLKLYDSIRDTFRSCPASTKFHHNWKGGLYDHTIEVIDYGEAIYEDIKDKAIGFTRDDVIFVCFAHDLDKLDKYSNNPDFGKNGKWTEDQEFVWNKKKISVNAIGQVMGMLVKFGIEVTDMQLNALTFAHGGWSSDKGNMEPLATILHCSDILSLAFGIKNRTEGEIHKEYINYVNEEIGNGVEK